MFPSIGCKERFRFPKKNEFALRGEYVGHNSLKVYDYYLFAQEAFANWVKTMADAVRATGSQQLITLGQDEGGIQDRLSPAFWGEFVDFTTNHSWWQNDYVVWDSLLAKQPGKAMLIQETGLQRELNPDEIARRTPESEAALLERKVAASFIQGSGAIEWLWNTNSYMTESNETPIGAVRTDATEKPEATVMESYAAFAVSLQSHLRNPQQPPIAIDHLSGRAIFGTGRSAAGSATQSHPRAYLLQPADSLRGCRKSDRKARIPQACHPALTSSFERNRVESPAGVRGRRRQSAHHRPTRP